MSAPDLSTFPVEVGQQSFVGEDVLGDNEVIVLNSKIHRHLMAHRSDPVKFVEMVQGYYQTNVFFFWPDPMIPSPDPKALINLNDFGRENLRKLYVNLQ